MCFNDNSQCCSIIIIVIFILYTIKYKFYNSTHLYEFIKFVIAIFLIIFCLYLFLVLIKKIYNNRIVPEENDIEENDIEENEENNIEITVPPDGVHS